MATTPLWPALHERTVLPERMDQPGLDPGQHRRALAGLARINRFSAAVPALIGPIARLARELGRPLRLLDFATGGGDLPVALWRAARRRGIDLRLTACDASLNALRLARRRAAHAGAPLATFVADGRAPLPLPPADSRPPACDVVLCSLFLHHLPEPDARRLLGELAARTGHLLLVNDLLRSRTGYLLAWGGTRLLSRSPIVHADGPLSVRAAPTAAEAGRMAAEAGLAGAVVRPLFPCRYLLTWRRP